jgi:5-oxoprolinase (ATP-hydrolysing)
MIAEPRDGDFVTAFTDRHRREFSFVSNEKRLIVDGGFMCETKLMLDIRVTAVSRVEDAPSVNWSAELAHLRKNALAPSTPLKMTEIYFDETNGFVQSPVYNLCDVPPGTVIHGPAIILDETQTIVVFPANEATILDAHVYIDVGLGARRALDTSVVDPIALSIFGNRCVRWRLAC